MQRQRSKYNFARQSPPSTEVAYAWRKQLLFSKPLSRCSPNPPAAFAGQCQVQNLSQLRSQCQLTFDHCSISSADRQLPAPPALALGLLADTGLLQPVLVRLSILVLKSAVSLPVVVLRCRALLKLSTCQANTARLRIHGPADLTTVMGGVLPQATVCMPSGCRQATSLAECRPRIHVSWKCHDTPETAPHALTVTTAAVTLGAASDSLVLQAPVVNITPVQTQLMSTAQHVL